ncbi:hypothetical protein GGR58DRAFT_450839 [Xylaria digitata]|nr:hypothetical protein GGR58DRAFT_450839 [Xylaria digitata]
MYCFMLFCFCFYCMLALILFFFLWFACRRSRFSTPNRPVLHRDPLAVPFDGTNLQPIFITPRATSARPVFLIPILFSLFTSLHTYSSISYRVSVPTTEA